LELRFFSQTPMLMPGSERENFNGSQIYRRTTGIGAPETGRHDAIVARFEDYSDEDVAELSGDSRSGPSPSFLS